MFVMRRWMRRWMRPWSLSLEGGLSIGRLGADGGGEKLNEEQGAVRAVDGEPYRFEQASLHKTFKATLHTGELVGNVLDTAWPKVSWWWKNTHFKDKIFRRITERIIKEQIMKAVGWLESDKRQKR
jgi:hypothetical protein